MDESRRLYIRHHTYRLLFNIRYALQIYFFLFIDGGYCSEEKIICHVMNTHPNLSPETAERAVNKVMRVMLENGIVEPSKRGCKAYRVKLGEEN